MIELRWRRAKLEDVGKEIDIDGYACVLQYREYQYSVMSDGSDNGSGWGNWQDVEISDD
jgi:hypothetical protein